MTQDYFVRGGPKDCIGTANDSGSMSCTDFLVFLQHFVTHVKPTKERPVLILLDHQSYFTDLAVLDYCKENHVILFTISPHCAHQLQPLDRIVFKFLNHHLREEQGEWVNENPGKVMQIFHLPSFIAKALPKAATPINIVSGFEISGIVPFNPDIFTDLDYARPAVTDHTNPNQVPDCSIISPPQPNNQQQCSLDIVLPTIVPKIKIPPNNECVELSVPAASTRRGRPVVAPQRFR